MAAYLAGKLPGVGYLKTVARTRGWHYVASWGHRITGVMLVGYVWIHTITMSSLTNPELFKSKMDFLTAWLPLFCEWLLAVPVIYHALNGGRLLLYELFGNRKDREVLTWVLGLSTVYLLLLGFFMVIGTEQVSSVFFWVYTVFVSVFLSYLVLVRLKRSGASIWWKMQRLTAAFMLLMVPAHMLFMHLDPTVGKSLEVIIARMDSIFIKLIDLLLIISAMYHGAYGLIGICRDYVSAPGVLLMCRSVIIILSVVFTWMGMKMIVLV